jgi:hypothetical protein
MKQRRWEKARREFEAVVRLEPGNARAQKDLEALQAARQRPPQTLCDGARAIVPSFWDYLIPIS